MVSNLLRSPSIGFYPVCLASNENANGSPSDKNAVENFENGKSLKITAKNNNKNNIYVSKITLNGKEIVDHKLS